MPEQHIFSTGVLSAILKSAFAVQRGNYQSGGPTGPSATPLANLSDGNTATVATCNSDAGGYEYFLVDLGAPCTISRIDLSNVSVAAGGTLGVSVSNTKSLVGIPGNGVGAPAGTTTGLVAASGNTAPVAGTNPSFKPVAGTTLVAQFLYISYTGNPNPGSNVSIGELAPYVAIPLGVIQTATLEHVFTRKELFDAAMNSIYAVDTADHEGKPVLKVESADLRIEILQYVAGAVLSTIGNPVTANVATFAKALKMMQFALTFLTLRQNGSTRVYTAGKVKAVGKTDNLKISDFAKGNFDLYFYDDGTGTVYTTQDN